MKKERLLWLMLFLAVSCGAALMSLDTIHEQLYVLRVEADEDTDLLDLTTEGNFANKPDKAVPWKTADARSGHGGNGPEITFTGGNAADDTFTYKLYGWRTGTGAARLIASGVGTLGTQAVVIYPQGGAATSKFWADTLTVTQTWNLTVRSSDTAGSNGIAALTFDATGFEWFWVEITDADGVTGTEAGDVTVYYSFW